MASSALQPEVALILTDSEGPDRVALWRAATDRLEPVATLPLGVQGTGIAIHPQWGSVYVATRDTAGSKLRGYFPKDGAWIERELYTSDRVLSELVFGTRPFYGDHGKRYRLFFAARSSDGSTSLRTVTEAGRLEYQVAGPEATVDSYLSVDSMGPSRITVAGASPMSVHPNGAVLIWKDQRGCARLLPYDGMDWGAEHALDTAPCGRVIRFAPNGRHYLVWDPRAAGVMYLPVAGRTGALEAARRTFLQAPVPVPDGRGVIGPVSGPDGGTVLVYEPVSVPLGDVANLWDLSAGRCEDSLLDRSSGFFRREGSDWGAEFDQLYSSYERRNYDEFGSNSPNLVTTDLFWENFAAAFNGVFILQERHRAMPAFWAFIDAAGAEFEARGGESGKDSKWAKAFYAVANYHAGTRSDEEGLIAGAAGLARSEALDSLFNYGELKPRGHYAADSALAEYFRAMRYLTEVGRVLDPSELDRLSPATQRRALTWIGVYLPYIAPPRPPELVWTEGKSPPMASYARVPRRFRALFPMGWGIDNEVLDAAAFNRERPVAELVSGPSGDRMLPSGLDVAAMFGNQLAAALLADTLRAYPPLAGVLSGIRARRPVIDRESSVYQRWVDAIAVEWADSSTFPGSGGRSAAWSVKRLQTGLASWATLREATILVTERAIAAEAGEGGFEQLIPEIPRGYVEPAPRTFEAIAGLYDALAASLVAGPAFDVLDPAQAGSDDDLRDGVVGRLRASAAEVRTFGNMAAKELRGEALTPEEYEAIRRVGGSVEHQFLLYKSLAEPDLAISTPDPLAKIADVAGNSDRGLLEVAVGNPLEWRQLVPFFGRRQIAIGSVYSYYEFRSRELYDNERWRREVERTPRPEWVRPHMAPDPRSCR